MAVARGDIFDCGDPLEANKFVLTLRSSGAAYGGPLTLFVRQHVLKIFSLSIGQSRHSTTKKSMKYTLLILFAALFSGCATTSTGAVSAGPNTFVVSRQAGAFPSGREPLLTEALAEAAATCASLNKTLKVISTAENPGPYILGNYPKATVMFSCA